MGFLEQFVQIMCVPHLKVNSSLFSKLISTREISYTASILEYDKDIHFNYCAPLDNFYIPVALTKVIITLVSMGFFYYHTSLLERLAST